MTIVVISKNLPDKGVAESHKQVKSFFFLLSRG
jgi:hypothetical protein